MLLSIFLGSNFVSSVIFDEDKKQFQKENTIKIPFNGDNLHPILTLKKLDELLAFYSDKEKEYPRIVTSTYCQQLNIKVDYSVNDIIEKSKITIIPIDAGCITDVSFLSENESANFLNLRRYHLNIPYKIRRMVDVREIANLVPNLSGSLIDSQKVLLSTVNIDKKDIDEYVDLCTRAVSNFCLITGNWHFYFDFDYILICKISAYVKYELDIWELFESLKPLSSLIIAPQVNSIIEIGDNEKLKGEKIELDKDKITKIDMKVDDKKNVEWKSSKSKFKGIITGSETGILVDTRDRNANKKI